MKATISKDKKSISITLPIVVTPSKSGKTMLVASSHGGKQLTELDGQPVTVSVNAYMPL